MTADEGERPELRSSPSRQDLEDLALKAGQVFSPSAPIDRRDLFAGRLKQLEALVDTVHRKGQHAIVYGERGVGKTSLVSVLDFIPGESLAVVRENCKSDDDFARIWKRALETIIRDAASTTLGYGKQIKIATTAAIDDHIQTDSTPDDIVSFLRRLDHRMVFVFDEFDQIRNRDVTQAFAEIVKALSDYAAMPKIVLVGVGDTIGDLISAHASAERALRQIPMPRMEEKESIEIVEKAMMALGTTCRPEAMTRVARMSQGLPHYVHSIGLHATRCALHHHGSTEVDMRSVNVGISEALSESEHSLLDAYVNAVSSPRKDALFRTVLVACALSKTDELGRFTPAAVRDCLSAMGRPLEIPAFSSHLNKFASGDRKVLQKSGTARRYRYRFGNPMLQPYVVMQGITDKVVGPDLAEQLLSR